MCILSRLHFDANLIVAKAQLSHSNSGFIEQLNLWKEWVQWVFWSWVNHVLERVTEFSYLVVFLAQVDMCAYVHTCAFMCIHTCAHGGDDGVCSYFC